MSKTLIGINTLTTIRQAVYANHCQFWFRLAKQFPNDEFGFYTPDRSSIDRMRNNTAVVAMEKDFDYVMFIDDDVLLPFDAYRKLRAADKDVVAGNVVIRGEPFHSMFFKKVPEGLTFYNDYPRDQQVIDVEAVGFSCVLIKVDLLKKMRPPFFITGPWNTEDVYFCLKAREQVPDVTIAVDTSVACGHLGDPQIFTPESAEKYRADHPEEKKNRLDRPEGYFEKCLKSL